MKITLLLFILTMMSINIIYTESFECSYPAPAENFKNSNYEGKWYEIGKIQTFGGAFFEHNCVCTELNVNIKNVTSGDGIADNDCRYKTNDGKWTNVTGNLLNEDLNKPGKWLEEINNNFVNYTVILIGIKYNNINCII
jgi:lipocalin